ncbi:hypothetical protein ONZ45_g10557 [Pleurotus djamor]|nr:hypothetical protein ONZ45_g10557 [Pleurotus djamor]
MSSTHYTTPRWASTEQRKLLHRFLPTLQRLTKGPDREKERKRLTKRWRKKWALDAATNKRISSFTRSLKPQSRKRELSRRRRPLTVEAGSSTDAMELDDKSSVMEDSDQDDELTDDEVLSPKAFNSNLTPDIASTAGKYSLIILDVENNVDYAFVPVPGCTKQSIRVKLCGDKLYVTGDPVLADEHRELVGFEFDEIQTEVEVARGVVRDDVQVTVKNGMLVVKSPILVTSEYSIPIDSSN